MIVIAQAKKGVSKRRCFEEETEINIKVSSAWS